MSKRLSSGINGRPGELSRLIQSPVSQLTCLFGEGLGQFIELTEQHFPDKIGYVLELEPHRYQHLLKPFFNNSLAFINDLFVRKGFSFMLGILAA